MIERTSPSWVMVGEERAPDHVMLYASNTLTSAELKVEIGDLAPWDMDGPFVTVPKIYTLEASMDQIVVIHARDWASAFKSLFEQWNPEPDRTQITGRVALPHANDTP
jgi:hypothetical protein